MSKKDVGKIGWLDLTVDDATGIKDFYAAVMGWEVSEVSVDDYQDYCVAPRSSDGVASAPVAGICHRRGANSDIPPQWLIYVTVENLDESIAQCERFGGSTVTKVRDMGSYGRMCIIRDPAGAVSAIIEPPE